MRARTLLIISSAIALVATFAGVSFAANAAAPEDGSWLDLLRPIYDAFAHGQYVLAGALALIPVVVVLRRYAAPRVEWLRSDLAAAGMTLAAAFGASMAAALGGGVAVSWAIVCNAGKIALTAAGGYSLLKPFALRLISLLPAWAAPLATILEWVFGKPAVISEAEKAGADAVAAKPPTGADGVVGKPEDL